MKRYIILFLLIIPVYTFALFNVVNKGAYSYAMGDASVAFEQGAYSLFINPAGLGKSPNISVAFSHQNIFGVPDLYSDIISFNYPLRYVRVGMGTSQLHLVNQYSEQIYYLSGASVIHIKSVPLYFGLSTKALYSTVNYQSAKSPLAFNFDFGVISDISKNLSLGFNITNILKNKLSFLDYEDEILPDMEAGIRYKWKDNMNFTADYEFNDKKLKMGWELWFYNVFAPRIGLNGEHLTAGFGLKSKRWSLDAALLSHNELGSNYIISFSYKFK